jgi:hypothetical protein
VRSPRLAAALLAGLWPWVAPEAAAASDAPLSVGTPGVFRSLFLELPLADARMQDAPAVDVRWWLANDWSVPTTLTRDGHVLRVQQDAQTDVLQLSASLPWSRLGKAAWLGRVRTSADLRLMERWGGFTDLPIERWHGLIGATRFQRDRYPADAVHLRLSEDGGASLADVHHAQPALSDLAVRTQATLLEGGAGADGPSRWAVAARCDLKLPTGRLAVLGGSEGVDAGLGLAATLATAGWFTFHGMAALRLVSSLPRGFPLRVEPVQWGLDLSVVLRLDRRWALVLEDRVSSSLFQGGWSLPPGTKEPEPTAYYTLFKPYNQISGGLRIGEATVFLQEDFTPGGRVHGDPGPGWFYNSNSPDVVLGVAWARRL